LENGSGNWSFGMVARLKPGVTPGQAQQDAAAISGREVRRSYRWHTVVRRLDSAASDAARPLMRTLALAIVSLRLGVPFLPETMPRLDSIHIDWSAAVFAILLSTLTGIACGLVPAMATKRMDLHDALKEGRTVTSRGAHGRVRSMLVVAELGITVFLEPVSQMPQHD
jgi:hypothetical protein